MMMTHTKRGAARSRGRRVLFSLFLSLSINFLERERANHKTIPKFQFFYFFLSLIIAEPEIVPCLCPKSQTENQGLRTASYRDFFFFFLWREKQRGTDLNGDWVEGCVQMATLQTWRKAYGALKDSTKVGLAHVNSDFAVTLPPFFLFGYILILILNRFFILWLASIIRIWTLRSSKLRITSNVHPRRGTSEVGVFCS